MSGDHDDVEAYLRDLADRIQQAAPRDDAPVTQADAWKLRASARILAARSGRQARVGVPDGMAAIRCERFRTVDDGEAFLLVIEAAGLAAAIGVELRAGGSPCIVHGGMFKAGAVRSCGRSLISAMRTGAEANSARMARIGLPTSDPEGFRHGLSHAVAMLAARGLGPSDATGGMLDPTLPSPAGWVAGILSRKPMAAPALASKAHVHEFPIGIAPDVTDVRIRPEWVDGWIAAASAALRPTGLDWPSRGEWRETIHSYYTAPGERGRNRRQAARSVPAFADMLHSNRLLTGAIDAGGSVHEALRARILNMVPGCVADGVTVSKVRRMRSIPLPVDIGPRFLSAVAMLPLHMLPDTAEGWEVFLGPGHVEVEGIGALGLDMGPLMRRHSASWRDPARIAGLRDVPGCLARETKLAEGLVVGIADMLNEFADTMLTPQMIVGTGLSRRHALRVAARTLLRPFTFEEAVDASRRWHDGLVEFRPILRMVGHETWPALFQPYEREGFTVACLTDTAGLFAEGMFGADPDGVAGLHHCVGGYAPRCAAGESHVASVRATGTDGRPVRLSTVEFVMTGARPVVRQHKGRANGPPPEAAEMVVRALARALSDGRHPFEVPPPRGRSPLAGGTLDPEVAFQAWMPHLPPRIARGGLAGLKAHLARDPDIMATGGVLGRLDEAA
jgi:hypothetical protein